jgi:CelD/BcsL family acetyltransferase involved in cellulose biosynthesis
VLVSKLITELSELDTLYTGWDELAVANRLPLMAPASAMAWWRHLAPARAEPRTVVVYDGEELVGLAPFYVDLARHAGRLDLRLPGIELAGGLAPLARPGSEGEVAREVASLLAASQPRADLVALEGMPLERSWGATLREHWPGRCKPLIVRYQVHDCPTVSLRQGGSFETWMAGKSSNFRGQMRRLRRHFDAAGGTTRTCTSETLAADVQTFMRLHVERWKDRGVSQLGSHGERMPAMLEDLGRGLVEQQRFRLQLLEIDGEPICAQLFLAAGGRVLYVNGGWDDRFAKLKPSMLGILSAIEHALEREELAVDLGLGAQPYKLRFAEENRPVAWTILMPVRARLALTAPRATPTLGRAMLRNAIKRRLAPGRIERYRGLRARLRGATRSRIERPDTTSAA